MLRALGYDVVGRTGSLEALEAFRARPDAFDLVITDMTMPGLTGMELARQLTAIRPDVPIILCTGFSELIDGKEVKEARIREFVLKPYATRNFAATIRKVLEGK
jgi:CheY-like chemotaxis protein